MGLFLIRLEDKGDSFAVMSLCDTAPLGLPYYISVLVEEKEPEKPQLNNLGLGIDLGIKDFATLSTGMVFKNINKTNKIRKKVKKRTVQAFEEIRKLKKA